MLVLYFLTWVLGQSCRFVLSQSFHTELVGSVLLYRVSPALLESGDFGGVTSDITCLFCDCLFHSFFSSISALKPVVPEDLNESAMIFNLLCLLLPCTSCVRSFDCYGSAFHLLFCALNSLHRPKFFKTF